MEPVLTWMVSGVLVGWTVRIAMRSRREFGIVGDLTLGLLGGVVGGWLFKSLGLGEADGGGTTIHVFVAVVGAATLVGSVRVIRRVVHVTGVSGQTSASRGDEFEAQLRALSEFERRVLSRVLTRRSTPSDPNAAFDAQLTFGQQIADRVAAFGGSWTFIAMSMASIVVWLVVNEEMARPFDAYPFILLNLVLSCVAALQAPVIMMSQNRQAVRDRLDAKSDYEVNLRAEMEIMGLHAKLDAVREREWTEFLTMQREQLEVLRRIEAIVVGAGDGAGGDGGSPA